MKRHIAILFEGGQNLENGMLGLTIQPRAMPGDGILQHAQGCISAFERAPIGLGIQTIKASILPLDICPQPTSCQRKSCPGIPTVRSLYTQNANGKRCSANASLYLVAQPYAAQHYLQRLDSDTSN